MVCIALYRLYALRYPLWISAVGHSRVPRMLLAAWGTAVISILPQLYVWREVDFGSFRQCVAIWTEKINLGGNRTLMTDMDFQLMKLYGIQNAIITFYIPLVILVVCYVLILKDIYKTLNASEPEMSSALYLSELSKLSTFNKRWSKKEKESTVSLTTRTIRGQDKLRRAKVRSLRITLLLILVYVITWLPNNLLSWWMVISFESYRDHQDTTFPLAFLVVLNSVINPFIYGRCQGLRLMFSCNQMEKRPKKVCRILHC
ncbi:7 transmembrane receptor [Ancylostoma caninum]|uniref:7 transmembrane receptor n=1 Tax=Ancylostoma caninum TaxID=29170 RepID=A0A368GJK9_ANCCA|nr:7 transmembrane receptor [Ancylostoma caninum]